MKRLYSDRDLVGEVRRKRKFNKWEKNGVLGFLGFLVCIFIGRGTGVVSGVVADVMQIISAGVAVLGIGGRRITESNRFFLDNLSSDLKIMSGNDSKISKLEDVRIVPKNIKIGEDTTGCNIADIFKEGHYVLIKSSPSSMVLRQLEEDGYNHVDILDYEEASYAITDLIMDNLIEGTFSEKVMTSLYKGEAIEDKNVNEEEQAKLEDNTQDELDGDSSMVKKLVLEQYDDDGLDTGVRF